jgi:hypothetical protein
MKTAGYAPRPKSSSANDEPPHTNPAIARDTLPKSVWNGRLLPQQDCVDVLEGATYS